MDTKVYFGLKQGIPHLFQKDGDKYINVVKMLCSLDHFMVEGKIKLQQAQVVPYENIQLMLLFHETTNYTFAEGDYDMLEPDHILAKSYFQFLEALAKQNNKIVVNN